MPGRDQPGQGILLLSLPFVGIERPALGLSLLKAQLQRAGYRCDVRYLTFDLASFIGTEDYRWVSDDLPYTAFVGDWLFTAALYDADSVRVDRYVDEVLRGEWHLTEADISRLYRIRQYCGVFLSHCLEHIAWSTYKVVGFTSTFTQNIASLALAQQVKAKHPDKVIVVGGGNWEGAMGKALLQRFDFVDFAFSGESDRSFPLFVKDLSRSDLSLKSIPGLTYRLRDGTVVTNTPEIINNLDQLPVPDFDDYFRDLEASPIGSDVAPRLILETSRGCWWGVKSHCTFCGLNGSAMHYRSKTPGRVMAEFDRMDDRYGVREFEMVDNILDMAYFKTLLPALANRNKHYGFFYETKSNLSQQQVRLLASAGVHTIQPGIESLSDRVLKLMRKGTTALQNVQLLKWCRQYGVRVEWNLLYGFPGERAEDYETMLGLLDKITFLDPPSGYGPVRLDRFSPYHSDPEAFNLTDIAPMKAYRFLYPFDSETLSRIAYYFETPDDRDLTLVEATEKVLARIRLWRSGVYHGCLRSTESSDGTLSLVDTRSNWTKQSYQLTGWRAEVYRSCERVRALPKMKTLALSLGVDGKEFDAFISVCNKTGLMALDNERVLALAVGEASEAKAAEYNSVFKAADSIRVA